MSQRSIRLQDAELNRLHHVKQRKLPGAAPLGTEMISFFKQSVQRRQTKMAGIAECWARLVPDMFNDHCALESYSRGSLTVIVDSASHLYELKQLLLSGLQEQLLITCRGAGLRKITLKPGRWYGDGEASDRRIHFANGTR